MANRYHTDDLRLAWFSRIKFRALSNAATRNDSLHSCFRLLQARIYRCRRRSDQTMYRWCSEVPSGS
ncbi:hypothetical protein GE21DRAFT_7817 [Neurospora crassa]|uniref:Uncharacterized protein n=1 Tax=Neurospora crassa (strain ATCC 24698 / 74-OR23-1A / CBS 708.71 / DSM 1257 / FGSC 987) TaxID=367110 RepID=Q7S7K5_NEUCR|nr:hypothetical protein NCU01383 [Neurospora crassa OR74A]EAA31704.1 hypothetical protein NCU01383 [Neurospora crassa OR74A]KHE80833.1 hypothetical protein GE21DRAFT_7817 [Neurospora crassa]|eukprot:XP_960940.1 hypothetical protein NCU01383 [Neurospora crassa OR74A]